MTDLPEQLQALAGIDPMERIVAEALIKAGVEFVSDFNGGNPSNLDFCIANGVEIEVKRMHSPRIAEQMARAENVIAVQGKEAVEWFASLIAALASEKRLREALRKAEEALRDHACHAVGAPCLRTAEQCRYECGKSAGDALIAVTAALSDDRRG